MDEYIIIIIFVTLLAQVKPEPGFLPSQRKEFNTLEGRKSLSAMLSRRQYDFRDIDLSKMTEEQFKKIQSLTTKSGGVTMPTKRRRTVPYRVSLDDDCDYMAFICMRAHKTGRVCGRTMYYKYHTYDNYCQLNYVNCMENFIMWQVAYMGKCEPIETLVLDSYELEVGDLDSKEPWLDENYVIAK